MSGDEKMPFWAECGVTSCKHRWVVAYFPMEAALFASIAINASKNCPKCGGTEVFVAKQNDGALTEQLS